MFLQKESSHCRNSLIFGPQGLKDYIFGNHFYSKMPESVDSLYSSFLYQKTHHIIILLEAGPNSQEIVNFIPIVGPREPELNWNKFKISCEFGPL